MAEDMRGKVADWAPGPSCHQLTVLPAHGHGATREMGFTAKPPPASTPFPKSSNKRRHTVSSVKPSVPQNIRYDVHAQEPLGESRGQRPAPWPGTGTLGAPPG